MTPDPTVLEQASTIMVNLVPYYYSRFHDPHCSIIMFVAFY